MGDENERSVNVGHAQGGPLDGELVSSRFPKGILVVDKPGNRAWVYDWNGSAFLCRDDEPRELDNAKRWEAADGDEYDVRAYEVTTNDVVEEAGDE